MSAREPVTWTDAERLTVRGCLDGQPAGIAGGKPASTRWIFFGQAVRLTDRILTALVPHVEARVRQAKAEGAEAVYQAVLALHEKVENPRHGCCAPPKLCQGHAPECRAREHRLGGVRWPCPTVEAARAAREASNV